MLPQIYAGVSLRALPHKKLLGCLVKQVDPVMVEEDEKTTLRRYPFPQMPSLKRLHAFVQGHWIVEHA